MLVLHAAQHKARLLLWAEKHVEEDRLAAHKTAPCAQAKRPEPLLFDAGKEGLAQALHQAALGVRLTASNVRRAVAWLPAQGGLPVPSSSIVCDMPPSRAKPALAPFAVTVAPLSGADAVLFLCGCIGRRTLAPGVIVGMDLAFWTRALRFAGALVARQQFLPDLVERSGVFRALWLPVFAGGDGERLTELAAAMPGAARALYLLPERPGRSLPDAEESEPPETSPREALIAFLSAAVDHLVRAALEAAGRWSGGARRGRAGESETIHDAWLSALRSENGIVEATDSALGEFAESVRAWRRPALVSVAAPFRLCLRLEEPPEKATPGGEDDEPATPESEKWYVRYLLQAADDPSLLVSLGEAWDARGRQAQLLERRGLRTREYVLTALGQAAGICPRIAASLRTARPEGYELDVDGAYDFLTERALALEQAGFGVRLPAWWTLKGTKMRLSASVRVKSPARSGDGVSNNILSLNEIVQFNWNVALGGKKLSKAELETLANLKAPLVKMRGQWVELNAEEIRHALAFWKRKAAGEMTVRDLVRTALGADEPEGAIEFEGVRATGWIGRLLDQLDSEAAIEELASPEGLEGTLRPYQQRGYSWLAFLRRWGLGACLADDMGLGKTIQTLALILRDRKAGERRPTLIVCPTSVVNNWRKEAERFTPALGILAHHGPERKRAKAFQKLAEESAIVLTSYALLHRDLRTLETVEWAGVVLDEAQNVKNPATKQAQAARQLRAEYRIALTGTPVENHVGDLWSIMEFLNPGLLGPQATFRRNFLVPIQASHDSDAAERLRRLTGPFILRRLKTDKTIISDLPEKQEMQVFCTLTEEQASLYAAVLQETEEGLHDASGIQRRGLILATLSKLKQVCNHPTQFLGDNSSIAGRSGKLARLTEMLEEVLEVGECALVFSQFAEMGKILQRHVEETFGREALFLHGAVPKSKRDRMIERFQDPDGPPVFILSLKAGGTGLNLTRANHVFHFDRWWNPAVENQATDRAFRIGQTRNVQVHKFLCAGTMEEKIDEMIRGKQDIAERVVGTGEGWITELSNQELRQVFALSKEAVGD